MARDPNEVAKDLMGNLMLQITLLTSELEKVQELNTKLTKQLEELMKDKKEG